MKHWPRFIICSSLLVFSIIKAFSQENMVDNHLYFADTEDPTDLAMPGINFPGQGITSLYFFKKDSLHMMSYSNIYRALDISILMPFYKRTDMNLQIDSGRRNNDFFIYKIKNSNTSALYEYTSKKIFGKKIKITVKNQNEELIMFDAKLVSSVFRESQSHYFQYGHTVFRYNDRKKLEAVLISVPSGDYTMAWPLKIDLLANEDNCYEITINDKSIVIDNMGVFISQTQDKESYLNMGLHLFKFKLYDKKSYCSIIEILEDMYSRSERKGLHLIKYLPEQSKTHK